MLRRGYWAKLNKLATRAGREAVKGGKKILYAALVLYYCLQAPDTPAWARGVIIGALGYLISPVDAVPDFLPVVGLVDDLKVLAAAFTIVLAHINLEHKRAAKEKMEELGVGSDVCGDVNLPHADEP